jgi:hypothetical protein
MLRASCISVCARRCQPGSDRCLHDIAALACGHTIACRRTVVRRAGGCTSQSVSRLPATARCTGTAAAHQGLVSRHRPAEPRHDRGRSCALAGRVDAPCHQPRAPPPRTARHPRPIVSDQPGAVARASGLTEAQVDRRLAALASAAEAVDVPAERGDGVPQAARGRLG